ncbi:phosphodiester glycosidase family protein [Acidimangrovimonas sediminis]|uniref:phosphodiester glycosidase family protein n=1 Tax=Acidimangrovimonas sediminis TaxID=2056283 RepID=UPI000C7FC650|nr:phosphodiester glycosidase family protein [Acidimangrovimonas sediminis]
MSATAAATGGGPCQDITYQGTGYTLCTIHAGDDLRIWQNQPGGTPFGSFEQVNSVLKPEGERLAFAMNGGMYHPDRQPVGLTIVGGKEVHPIVTTAGPGNFGMLPNGVFCIGSGKDAGFSVVESRRFSKSPPACGYATQSGPMLVIDGALHPRFMADSDSTHIRNGVGVSADGRTAVFAISDGAVTFHDFASLFLDKLKMPNALYLDGSISRLYAPGLGREDIGLPLGPIIGLVTPAQPR